MVTEVTGVERQLTPEEQQIVGPEVQEPRVPGTVLPRIEEPEKREVPLPVTPRPPLPPIEVREAEEAAQILFGVPVLKINRYTGGDPDFQPLVRWDIPDGRAGDLHEISLLSNNDAVTRYRIVIGNIDQELPTDRPTSTPVAFPWRRTIIPGASSVYVEVMSTDGTNITVDGTIIGTER